MFSGEHMDLVIGLVRIGLVGLLLWGIVTGKLTGGRSGMASITAFHDLQPKDKQDAVEVIINENAGKQRFQLPVTDRGKDPGNQGGEGKTT